MPYRTMERKAGIRKMKKTEIIYTRLTKPNDKYLRHITHMANTSMASCLDGVLSFMRENMEDTTLIKELAKRRNEIRENSKPISGHAS